jgi:hypothetical protein
MSGNHIYVYCRRARGIDSAYDQSSIRPPARQRHDVTGIASSSAPGRGGRQAGSG